MGNVGGPRHYQGGKLSHGPYKWTCPTCGNEWVHPLEEGCPVCREAATKATAPAAVHATREVVDRAVLGDSVNTLSPTSQELFVGLDMLSGPARDTVAAALALWVELGTPSATQLPKNVALAWARIVGKVE